MDAIVYILMGVAIVAVIVLVWCCVRAASHADDQVESLVAAKRKAWSGAIPHYTPPTLSGKAAKGIRPKDAA